MEQLVQYFVSLGMPMAQALQTAQSMAGQQATAPQPQYSPEYRNGVTQDAPRAVPASPPPTDVEAARPFRLETGGHMSTSAMPTPSAAPAKQPRLNQQGIDYDEAHSAMVQHLAARYKMKPEEATSFAQHMLTSNDGASQKMRNEALQHLVRKAD